jgi:transcriptional regulator with XRE-family HTH domain
MTQKEIAERLNVSDKTISKWETGSSYPDIALLNSIAKVLEIDVSSLLGAADLKESSAEKEVYDYLRIQKFKTMSIISILLLISGIILAVMIPIFDLEYNDTAIMLFLILGIGSAITGIAMFLISVSSFRNFYTHKFFTKEYDISYYSYTTAFLHVLLFICLLILLSVTSIVSIFFAVLLFPILGFFLFRIRKSTQLLLKRTSFNKVLMILYAVFLVIAVVYLIPHVTPITMGTAVWGLLLPLYVLSIVLSYNVEYKEK